jgi:hypothetical protein
MPSFLSPTALLSVPEIPLVVSVAETTYEERLCGETQDVEEGGAIE